MMFALCAFSQERYWVDNNNIRKDSCQVANFDMQQLPPSKKAKILGGEYKVVKVKGAKAATIRHSRLLKVSGCYYLNLEGLRNENVTFGKYFAPCYRISKDTIVFVALRISKNIFATSMNNAVSDAMNDTSYDFNERNPSSREKPNNLLSDVVNTLLNLRHEDKKLIRDKVCYIYNVCDNSVVIVDGVTMPCLLRFNPKLLAEYEKLDPKTRTSADIVISYLQQAGCLSR